LVNKKNVQTYELNFKKETFKRTNPDNTVPEFVRLPPLFKGVRKCSCLKTVKKRVTAIMKNVQTSKCNLYVCTFLDSKWNYFFKI